MAADKKEPSIVNDAVSTPEPSIVNDAVSTPEPSIVNDADFDFDKPTYDYDWQDAMVGDDVDLLIESPGVSREKNGEVFEFHKANRQTMPKGTYLDKLKEVTDRGAILDKRDQYHEKDRFLATKVLGVAINVPKRSASGWFVKEVKVKSEMTNADWASLKAYNGFLSN